MSLILHYMNISLVSRIWSSYL